MLNQRELNHPSSRDDSKVFDLTMRYLDRYWDTYIPNIYSSDPTHAYLGSIRG
jgi:hypothetical protein